MLFIHFIVHSISSRQSKILENAIMKIFSNKNKYRFSIKHSNYKGHAIELTKESIKDKTNIIVACGGDGTINEVARNIVGSNITLGIVPMGSGNGLASHLKISKNIIEALNILKKHKIIKIDVGKINHDYFFSNTGVAFDVVFAKNYNSINKRGIIAYAYSFIISLFNFKYLDVKIYGEKMNQFSKPFLLLVSNSNELGYNMSLTPKASLIDGKLDFILVDKMNWFKILSFLLMTLFRFNPCFEQIKRSKIQKLEILSSSKELIYQIDGELVDKRTKHINISVLNRKLKVIAK